MYASEAGAGCGALSVQPHSSKFAVIHVYRNIQSKLLPSLALYWEGRAHAVSKVSAPAVAVKCGPCSPWPPG